MEDLMQLATSIPIWVWVILGLFIYVMIFGDRKLWELEVKFPVKQGVGRGEVEFECHKKKGSSIEVKFQIEELFNNKPIEIFLNNRLVYTVPASKNSGNRIYVEEKLDLEKPNEGDKVLVNIDGTKQFEGVLVRD